MTNVKRVIKRDQGKKSKNREKSLESRMKQGPHTNQYYVYATWSGGRDYGMVRAKSPSEARKNAREAWLAEDVDFVKEIPQKWKVEKEDDDGTESILNALDAGYLPKHLDDD